MPTKLRFKGDKAKKKRKHVDGEGYGEVFGEEGEEVGGDGSSLRQRQRRRRRRRDGDEGDEGDEDEDGGVDGDMWVFPERVEEIRGPVFIMHLSNSESDSGGGSGGIGGIGGGGGPCCVAFDATRGRAVLVSLDKEREKGKEREEDGGDDEAEDEGDAEAEEEGGEGRAEGVRAERGRAERREILSKTPTDVSQVWVATRVAGSDTLTLRTGIPSSTGSGETKFLSCDEHGLVSAYREARGPQESWTPVILSSDSDANSGSGGSGSGMVAFQSIYEKYLSVDEVAGGGKTLRGDGETIGSNEKFLVKVQAKYKKEAGEEERKKREGERKARIDEAGTNKTFQAWGAGRSIVSQGDKKELKKARKEGKLAEALLDRRAKLKSDRFC